MSSTNRGGQRSEADNYPTPAWLVDRLLEACPLPGGRWLEPSAGDGAIIRAVNARRQDVRWTAVELRDCAQALRCASVDQTGKTNPRDYKPSIIHSPHDFLKWLPAGIMRTGSAGEVRAFAVCLMNPPYSLAAEFIERALYIADVVAAPLRLNFLGSEARAEWFENVVGMPDVFVSPNRPDFSGQGGDSCEYAWMVWTAARKFDAPATVRLLATTPRAVRVAQKPGR
jgi:hypothetical protein